MLLTDYLYTWSSLRLDIVAGLYSRQNNIRMQNGLDDFGDSPREAFKEGGIVHFSAFGPEPGLQSSKEKYVVIRSIATFTTIQDLIDRVSLRVH